MMTVVERYLSTQEKTLATLEELRKDVQALHLSRVIEQAQPKPSKKKFVVVGLKPNQANEVRSRFADMVDIEFVEANKFRSLPSCDIVFVMTGFVDHAVYNSIKSAKSDAMMHVNGGVSGLVNRIKEFVS